MPENENRLNNALRRIVVLIVFTALVGGNISCGKGKNMGNNTDAQELLKTAATQKEDLATRIRALDELAAMGDAGMCENLKRLLNRAKPHPIPIKNWDPVAAERVIDLHIVKALCLLGDNSELYRLPVLVGEAGDILLGPEDELANAASVILGIGQVEPVHQLVIMTRESAPQVVKNAVNVLKRLDLPHAPLGGEVSPVLGPAGGAYSFEIATLKQELETLVHLSKGRIVLSDGVKNYLLSNDYERGPVKRVDTLLAQIVEQDLALLDFDYFVADDNTVIVCTHEEAGRRWRDWWQKYGGRLKYSKKEARFVLSA